MIITGWTDAPISWPRYRPADVPKSHPSLLVDNELACAIRSESALALRHWWGVSAGVVWRWRKALGVGRMDSAGSVRLIRAAVQQGAQAMREREWPAEERAERCRRAIEGNYVAFLPTGYQRGRCWTAEELALLGKAPDEEVAAQTGRTVEAVRIKRGRRLALAQAGESHINEGPLT